MAVLKGAASGEKNRGSSPHGPRSGLPGNPRHGSAPQSGPPRAANDDIFVFGSNLAGVHGAGAALCARMFHGAELGMGNGPTGDSYAIPTKDFDLQTRPVDEIALSVGIFLAYARANTNLRFYVTRIGCGYAGYTDADIAPLFAGAPSNCILPQGWPA